MFSGHFRRRQALLGIVLLFATIVFIFGHSVISPNLLALEDGQVHVDEVPHGPESDEHSPCPTHLHETVTTRHGQNDPDEHLDGDTQCPVTLDSYASLNVLEARVAFRASGGKQLPPDLPLDQRTHLLL